MSWLFLNRQGTRKREYPNRSIFFYHEDTLYERKPIYFEMAGNYTIACVSLHGKRHIVSNYAFNKEDL